MLNLLHLMRDMLPALAFPKKGTSPSLTTKNKKLLNEYLDDENYGDDISCLERFLEK